MKRRSVLFIIGGILVLVVAVVIVNFTLKGSKFETAIPVRGFLVARGTLEDRVSGNGTFTPKSTVTVVAQVSGAVSSVRVEEGDPVRQGGVLLTLRDDDYRLALQKTKASVDSTRRTIRQSLVTLRAQYRGAVSTLTDSERTFGKNKELFAARSISEEAYQKSADALESAQVNWQSVREQLDLRCGLPVTASPPTDGSGDDRIVEQSPEMEEALLSVRSAQDNVTRCTVTAPAAGVVTKVNPSVGDMVALNAPLVRIEDLGDMLAEIQVDEVDIGKIHLGQPAEVTSDSLIGVTLKGTVETIAPTVTTLGSTRVSLVDVRISRASLRAAGDVTMRSGASCTGRITTSIKKDTLLIPLSSFTTEENVTSVFRLTPTGKKNQAGAEVFQLSKKQVTIGSSDVNSVEVTAGLAEGDRIVAGNLKMMRDGILVTLRKD
jgi:HlyD family secretion protein